MDNLLDKFFALSDQIESSTSDILEVVKQFNETLDQAPGALTLSKEQARNIVCDEVMPLDAMVRDAKGPSKLLHAELHKLQVRLDLLIPELLAQAELPRGHANGLDFLPKEDYYFKRLGEPEEIYNYLKKNGYEDAVEETVNGNKLKSIYKEIMLANDGKLPPELAALIEVEEFRTVNARKAK